MLLGIYISSRTAVITTTAEYLPAFGKMNAFHQNMPYKFEAGRK
jgi:hypothetical protein